MGDGKRWSEWGSKGEEGVSLIISTWPIRASVTRASAAFKCVGLLCKVGLGDDLRTVPGLKEKPSKELASFLFLL